MDASSVAAPPVQTLDSGVCISQTTFAPLNNSQITKLKSFITSDGLRHDGRKCDALRPTYVKRHALQSPSGSAYFSRGQTKISCSIHGPKPIAKNSLKDEGAIEINITEAYSVADVGHSDLCGHHTWKRYQRFWKEAIESIVHLEKYLKCVIDIRVVIIQDDGGVFTSGLTCISLALLDAGIEIVDIISSISLYSFCLPIDNELQEITAIDLDAEELSYCQKLDGFKEIHLGICPNKCFYALLDILGTYTSSQTLLQTIEKGTKIANLLAKHIVR